MSLRHSIIAIMIMLSLTMCGCGQKASTETDQPSGSTAPSSEQPSQKASELPVHTIPDQRKDWQEGTEYPGVYAVEREAYDLMAESTGLIQENCGEIYAYIRLISEDNKHFEHYVQVFRGDDSALIKLSDIPVTSGVSEMQVSDRTIWVLSMPYFPAEEEDYISLYVYQKDGKLLFSGNVEELIGEKVAKEGLSVFTDKSDHLWLRVFGSGKLYQLSQNGSVERTVSIPEGFQGGFLRGNEDGELIAILRTDSEIILSSLNYLDGTQEKVTIKGIPMITRCFTGEAHDLLLMNERSLYAVDLGADAKVNELLVFTDCGIDYSMIRTVSEQESGKLLIVTGEGHGKTGEVLTLEPYIAGGEKGITIACLSSSEFLRYAVSQYNESDPEIKVQIREYYDLYAIDSSKEDAALRLISDLLNGSAGDIVCLDGMDNGTWNALAEKGVFRNLYEFMEDDARFDPEKYFTDVWRVNETEGKLYRLVPLFSLYTKFAKESDVGHVTHLDESVLFEEDEPVSLFGYSYTRKLFVHDLCVFSLGSPYDQNSAFYDQEMMTKYARFASQLPEHLAYIDEGDFDQVYNYAGFRDIVDLHFGRQRFYQYQDVLSDYQYGDETHKASFGRTFRLFRNASAFFGETKDGYSDPENQSEALQSTGEKVVMSGFPVKEGAGSALINCLSLAIPSATMNPKAAWDFLKSTLSERYQSSGQFIHMTFPVRKSAFESYVKDLLQYDYTTDPAWGASFSIPDPDTGIELIYWIPPTKQWMIDDFKKLLSEIRYVDEVDSKIEQIILEEVDKAANGRQTAEEAARNIAERVELYRDER